MNDHKKIKIFEGITRNIFILGIVKGIIVKGDKVEATIAFPIPNIPIKDEVVNRVRGPIAKLGAEFEVNV